MQSSWLVSQMPLLLTGPHRLPPRAAAHACAHASLQILGCPNLRPTLHQHQQLRCGCGHPARCGGGASGRHCPGGMAEGGGTGEVYLGAPQQGFSLGKHGGSSDLSSLLVHSEVPQRSHRQDSSRRVSERRGMALALRIQGKREGARLPSEEPPQGPRAAIKALTGCCPAGNRP